MSSENASAEPLPVSHYRERLELAMGIPFSDGNAVKVLNNGDEIFPAMLEAIGRARSTIDFETYVYWKGNIAVRFAEALADRARAGLRVRVLLDSLGAKRMRDELLDLLGEAGVEVRWFRPLATWKILRNDNRTHRKLLICDGQIGFNGGVGIAEEWEGDARGPGEWRDVHVRFDGPAVNGLRAAFIEHWNEAGPWVWDDDLERPQSRRGGVPVQIMRSSATVGWSELATLLRSLVSLARREIRIATAYFVPDRQLIELFERAKERGIEVEILTPGTHTDSPISQLAGLAGVERLLAKGVRVYRYQRTMLHSKCLTVDGVLSCVGSANLNRRSLGKDEECCAVVLSEEIATGINRNLDEDRSHSRRLTLEELQSRGLATRIKERLAWLVIDQV